MKLFIITIAVIIFLVVYFVLWFKQPGWVLLGHCALAILIGLLNDSEITKMKTEEDE